MNANRGRTLLAIVMVAATGVVASGFLASGAQGAPANDRFESRAVIASPLPAEAQGSSVGATDEAGEYISGRPFDSGHSVWWAWEAPATQFVTIGSCGTEFRPELGVFTGDELGALTRAVPPAATEGLNCASRLTFRATAGTTYDIGVDGDGYHVPGSEPAQSEGLIDLQITATPAPANDAFADPAPFQSLIQELPNGNRFYAASAEGDNFGATKEVGEPVHAGIGAGVSVWYHWTPIETGPVSFSVCCGENRAVLAVYTGTSLANLVPVTASADAHRGVEFVAEVGQEYRIAFDGVAEPVGGETWMGDFHLDGYQQLPWGPPFVWGAPSGSAAASSPAPPAATRSAPTGTVKIQGYRLGAAGRRATFRFHSSAPGARFRCALDSTGYRACSSPLMLRHLNPGKHSLAVAIAGGIGVTRAPTVVRFSVPAARPSGHADR